MPYKSLKTKAWFIIICAILCSVCIIGAAIWQSLVLMAASWLVLAVIIVVALSILHKDTGQRYSFRQLAKPNGSPEQSLHIQLWAIIIYTITCFALMSTSTLLHRSIAPSYIMMGLVIFSAGRILYETSHCENDIAPSAED